MPIVQKSIDRVNRVLMSVLDKPFVAKMMSPMQPIANTLTTRYLDYAIPGDGPPSKKPVAYTVIDAEGNTAWQGDTKQLAKHPEYRRHQA